MSEAVTNALRPWLAMPQKARRRAKDLIITKHLRTRILSLKLSPRACAYRTCHFKAVETRARSGRLVNLALHGVIKDSAEGRSRKD
eukprot:3154322-Pleurochrysis_carterae.AAC.5